MLQGRLLLAALCLFIAAPLSADEPKPIDSSLAKADAKDSTLWYDAHLLTIEGMGWEKTKAPFDRLPPKAEGSVRKEVWNLSRHSSGIAVLFRTDATKIYARWNLESDRLAMPHMPASSVSGLDLYVRDDQGKWRWLSCTPPSGKTNSKPLIAGIPEGTRTYLLYLPLYNAVSKLEVGVPRGDFIAAAPPRPEDKRKPIVFYGTSITHGASASRSGMVHTAILGRRFDRPVINLGFSGNGRLEPEVARLLAELDPAVFVIDCLPNVEAEQVLARTKPCIEILRKARPETPILLVEDRSYANGHLVTASRKRNLESRKALQTVYKELVAGGARNLYYLEGENLLGDDAEGTVDSSHPTDLGFMRQADAFAKVLGPILQGSSK